MTAKLLERHLDQIKLALKIRRTEFKLLDLYCRGLVSGTVHSAIGQEMIPVQLYRSLQKGGWVFSNHRGLGHYLARTEDFERLIGEVLSRESRSAGGIGGSQHLVSDHFMSNGIQGGMTPVATGVALACQRKQNDGISACHIGDGTLGQGILYEALNMSSLWYTPVLFVVEDNGIAQTTLTSTTIAGEIKSRFDAFGLTYFGTSCDEWDDLYETGECAVSLVRGGRPALLHIKTRRLLSHSKGDDNRDPGVIDTNKKANPLNKALAEHSELESLVSESDEALEEISIKLLKTEKRTQGPIWHQVIRKAGKFIPTGIAYDGLVIEQVHDTLHTFLETRNDAVLLGEDVKYRTVETPEAYGGAFKVTGNLSDLYPNKVKNTPISEAGLAFGDIPAAAETMFGDFTTLIVDQRYQHAAKFRNMNGRTKGIPVTARFPMGGRRGYGPTHSQSLERLFLAIPDLHVVCPNHRLDSRALYKAVFDSKSPALFTEHKLGHGQASAQPLPNGYALFRSEEELPTVVIKPQEQHATLTILTYDYGLKLAEEAAAELGKYGIFVEITAPSSLNPFNAEHLLKSAVRTGQFVYLEEGSASLGLGAMSLAYLTTQAVTLKNTALPGNDSIITAAEAENSILPTVNDIIEAVVKFRKEAE